MIFGGLIKLLHMPTFVIFLQSWMISSDIMRQKFDALTLVPRVFTLVETQFENTIKQFRFDNASELAFTDFFHTKGVLHQYSCVARPVQNSLVERKSQDLLNVARS